MPKRTRFRILLHQHGTTTGAQYGCRCGPCLTAAKAYRDAYRARHRPSSPPDPSDPPPLFTWPELVAMELERQERGERA